jgi:NAD(P)-dependent dehydrogenase (short-subunit alcohol dehydrogenase family)
LTVGEVIRGLEGAAVLVTGGASGIGRATALEFGGVGAKVCIVDIDRARGEESAGEIADRGGQAILFTADVSNSSECRAAVEHATAAFGGLNVLVNAAGVIQRKSVLETAEADWDHILGVNLKSVFLLSKFAIPHMQKAGGGAIVNVASGWGIRGGKDAAAYCASKGGVVLLTKAMARDHAQDGIRVNCVCPGDVDTAMLRAEARDLGVPIEEFMRESADRPLGRVGTPQEVARAILFLASPMASYISGEALVVDGGGLA